MEQKLAQDLIKKTTDDYNSIAGDFSRTREYLSPDLLALKKYYKKGQKVLDLGCGNGRLSELFENDDYLGIDISKELISIAQKKYPKKKFVLSRPLQIPLEENSIDIVFCLATIHHIPSVETRNRFYSEIKRVLKKDEKVIITSWYLYKEKKALPKIIVANAKKLSGLNKYDYGDIFLPFFDNGRESQRYLHAFTVRGLSHELKNNGFKIIQAELNVRAKNRNLKKKHYNIEIIAKVT